MEEVNGELQVFSAILLQEYIRLMTAACYINEENCNGAKFKISAENYAKMMSEPLQAPLIGLNLSYNETQSVLNVAADVDFIKAYQDKNLKEVALKYWQNYLHRYESEIILIMP